MITIFSLVNFIGLIALGVYFMVTKTEFITSLDEQTENLAKVQAAQEATKARVAELEAAINNGDNVQEEIVTAFERLKAQVQMNVALTQAA